MILPHHAPFASLSHTIFKGIPPNLQKFHRNRFKIVEFCSQVSHFLGIDKTNNQLR